MRFPARLHVLLAARARVGVVLRRGPSRSVASILWDRRTDEFELGQWLRARIYERRSDLAPDGRHLIYFALNGRWQSSTGGSWTAISRAPYLKAIVLLGKGDAWNGGGLFTGARTYWLNEGYGHKPLLASKEVERDGGYRQSSGYGGECPGVYYHRLQRDGWTLRAAGKQATIFDRTLAHGWVLRKHAFAEIHRDPGKGCYWDEHELVPPAGGETQAFPTWEWAERDMDDVVFAEEGRLYRLKLARKGRGEPRLLRDFNAMTFEALAAPY